jgi:acetyl esterase/lipase
LYSINSIKISVETFCYKKTDIGLHVTLYRSAQKTTRATLLYFHGGGLLYGKRTDLPEDHIDTFCNEGYSILTFDYRLAPVTKLPNILDDVNDAIIWYLNKRTHLFNSKCPYFLWGRSAGAYLCLLTGRIDLPEDPIGILSYYGYTFIHNSWYNHPNPYYTQFPAVDADTVTSICKEGETAEGLLDLRYSLYVYARQTGKWISMLIDNPIDDFYNLFSFKEITDFNNYPPVLLAHSFHDPDVPFAESQVLSSLLPKSQLFVASAKIHDFDKDTTCDDSLSLIEESICFMNEIISLL